MYHGSKKTSKPSRLIVRHSPLRVGSNTVFRCTKQLLYSLIVIVIEHVHRRRDELVRVCGKLVHCGDDAILCFSEMAVLLETKRPLTEGLNSLVKLSNTER